MMWKTIARVFVLLSALQFRSGWVLAVSPEEAFGQEMVSKVEKLAEQRYGARVPVPHDELVTNAVTRTWRYLKTCPDSDEILNNPARLGAILSKALDSEFLDQVRASKAASRRMEVFQQEMVQKGYAKYRFDDVPRQSFTEDIKEIEDRYVRWRDQLPGRERVAWDMSAEGLSEREIAFKSKTTRSSVRTQLSSAKYKFRVTFENESTDALLHAMGNVHAEEISRGPGFQGGTIQGGTSGLHANDLGGNDDRNISEKQFPKSTESAGKHMFEEGVVKTEFESVMRRATEDVTRMVTGEASHIPWSKVALGGSGLLAGAGAASKRRET